jgi:hypothetical protein
LSNDFFEQQTPPAYYDVKISYPEGKLPSVTLPHKFPEDLDGYFENLVASQRCRRIREFKITPDRTKLIADLAVLTFITTLPESSEVLPMIQHWIQFGAQSVTFPKNGESHLQVVDQQIFGRLADAILKGLSHTKDQQKMVRQNKEKPLPSLHGTGEEAKRRFDEITKHNLKVGSLLLRDLGIVRKAFHMRMEKRYTQTTDARSKQYVATVDASPQNSADNDLAEEHTHSSESSNVSS